MVTTNRLSSNIVPRIFFNVFILATGRCGTLSFISACRFITNYSAGHETRTALLGDERLNYPLYHIEADNRISWFLGRMDKKFGEQAFYVHLLRNRDDVSRSYAKRLFQGGIMKSYGDGILMPRQHPEQATKETLPIAYDMVDTVNSNIEMFLKDKPHQMTIHIESISEQFPEFFERIGAEGDLQAALKDLETPRHTSKGKSKVAKVVKNRQVQRLSDDVWHIRGNPDFPGHDRNGFRNPDSPGTDIFIVGDSWTYGSTLNKEQSWPILLSESFGVSCAASGSWGSFEYFLAVKEFMPAATKICLVAFYTGNDLIETATHTYKTKSEYRSLFWKDEYPEPDMSILSKLRIKYRQVEQLRKNKNITTLEAFKLAHVQGSIDIICSNIHDNMFIFRPYEIRYGCDLSIPLIRTGMDITKDIFGKIIEACDEQGIEPLFVIFPSKEACFAESGLVSYSELDQVLKNTTEVINELKGFFEDKYIRYVDMLDKLSENPQEVFQPNTPDGHPNAKGARIIADQVSEVLTPLLEEYDVNTYPLG